MYADYLVLHVWLGLFEPFHNPSLKLTPRFHPFKMVVDYLYRGSRPIVQI